MIAVVDDDAEQRRLRRANMEVKVFRPGEEEAAADYDALYWDRIPKEERANAVWDVSVELWQLAHPEWDPNATQPGSSRSVARAFKR
jgi:hypothetical protein